VLVKREANEAHVILPELPEAVRTMSLVELAGTYSGHAILLGRMQRFVAGTGSERIGEKHHWFWGTLRKEARTYTEIAIATVLINILALASPLFFMNVYDRVVPNHAMETLWVLALEKRVLLFDLLLKILRGYFIDIAANAPTPHLCNALRARDGFEARSAAPVRQARWPTICGNSSHCVSSLPRQRSPRSSTCHFCLYSRGHHLDRRIFISCRLIAIRS
jgi:hypothetical protein